jgi:hypothetical protein
MPFGKTPGGQVSIVYWCPLGDGIDARYMTQLRCSAMVLPSDGRPPIVIADPPLE